MPSRLMGVIAGGLLATQAAALPPSSSITIRGIVEATGEDSEIRIELVAVPDRAAAGELFQDGRAYPEAASQVTLRSGGPFRLTAPEAGMWEVIVTRPGTVPMAAKLHPLVDEAVLQPLDPPSDTGIHLRVVDSRGQPVPGARVLVYSEPEWRLDDYLRPSNWQPARRAGETRPDGGLILPRSKGETLTVEVVADGFPPVTRKVGGASATLRLVPGVERRIEVRAPGGQPASGAQARFPGMLTPSAIADDQGRMTVVVASGGSTDLDLLDGQGNHLRGPLGPPKPEPPRAPERVSLDPAVVLSGRVVGLPDRSPLPGALVWSRRDPGGAIKAGAGGAFVLRAPAEGDLLVSAAETGHFTSEITLAPSASIREVEYSFALAPRTSLTGIVVDENGRPVAGVEVTAVIDRRDSRLRSSYRKSGGLARTEGSGRFRLVNLAPEARYELRFSIPGHPPVTLTTVVPRAGEAPPPLRVVLREGIRAVGLVVDSEGEPVAGARVGLEPVESRDAIEKAARAMQPDSSEPFSGSTDTDGRFWIADLSAGRYDLTVRATGFADARIPGIEVRPARGEAEVGTVSLSPEAAIEGVVRGPSGEPLSGVTVRRVPDDPLARFVSEVVRTPDPEEAVTTGGDGRFRIGGLRENQALELALSKPRFAKQTIRARTPQESPLTVTLQPASNVSGRVTTPEGEPVEGASVSLQRASFYAVAGQVVSSFAPSPHRTFSAEDGSFRFEGVEPGRTRVEVAAADRLGTEESIDVPTGADVEDLEIVVRSAAHLVGQVLSPSGEPLAGAEIREAGVELPPGAIQYTAPLAVTDGDGRYRAGGLRPGALRFEADHPAYRRATRAIDAQPGENRLDFTLEGGSSISGYVVDSESGPVAAARVQLQVNRSGGSFPWTRTGADGRFEFAGLAPGRYRLSAEKTGFGRSISPVEVEVADEPVEGVEVALTPTGTIAGTIYGLDVDELARVQLQAGGRVGVGSVAFDGSYLIPDLSPGAWGVVATLPGTDRLAKGTVVLEAGETEASLDLDFGRGLVLSGSVVRSDRPVSEAGVVAVAEGGAPVSTQTDEAGRFRFEGLSEGRYILEVSDFATGAVRRLEIDLAGDRDVVVGLEDDDDNAFP